jgi:hypothetical protein
MLIHMLGLQRMEEAFCNRIVITVTLPTHALAKPIVLQDIAKIYTGILNAPVGMEDTARRRSTPTYCLIQ